LGLANGLLGPLERDSSVLKFLYDIHDILVVTVLRGVEKENLIQTLKARFGYLCVFTLTATNNLNILQPAGRGLGYILVLGSVQIFQINVYQWFLL